MSEAKEASSGALSRSDLKCNFPPRVLEPLSRLRGYPNGAAQRQLVLLNHSDTCPHLHVSENDRSCSGEASFLFRETSKLLLNRVEARAPQLSARTRCAITGLLACMQACFPETDGRASTRKLLEFGSTADWGGARQVGNLLSQSNRLLCN